LLGGPANGPAGAVGMAQVMFFLFFLFISQILTLYYLIIFLYLQITKASPRLTPYRLKDKKGSVALSCLIALKTMLGTERLVV
jgi:hypothetical protein